MDQPLPLSQSALAQSLVEEESDCSENSQASDLSGVFLSEGDDFNFEEEDDEDKPSRAHHSFEEEKEENDQTSRVQTNILPWREAFKFKQNWLHDTNAKIGPTNCDLNAKSAPVEFFSLIFDDNMFLDIMKWTNKRAADKIDDSQRRKTRMAKWKNMTLSEMKAFFAALYLMGITRLPYRDMHWHGNTTLFSAQGVKSLFSRRRFHDIYGSICLRDPTVIEPGNKLYKIEPFVLSIITNSQFYYRPHQDLSIDESMIAFTGRVGFKVYEPRKPIKRGLKAYVLCDAHTGYVLNWKLYTGRSKETVDDIVKKLVEGLENEGYRIFMDSYYTSVKLFQDLKDLNFGCCGTAVADRLHMSKQISTNITAGLGDHKIQYYQLESDPSILLNCWKDHKLVYVLSNYHSIRQVDVVRTLRRRDRTEETKRECLNCKETLSIPESIADYNAHMGGVDRFDQLASYYIPSLNARRWYLKVMFHLCEMAMINSYILYKSTYEAARTKCLRHLDYRKEVIRGLTRELRQSRFLLISPEKRKKCESKIDHIDTIFTASSQGLDLDLETSLQLLLESTQATATTQDTGTMQSLESSIMNNQNDFIIKRRQARNNQYTKTEFPQSIDNAHYTRSKGNIKLNFEIDTDIQKPLSRQGSVGQFEDNPCLLQKMTMSSLHAGNQRKTCTICKWKTIIQEEKEGIEWLKGKVQWQKKEPPKRKRFHKTLFWCETCEVPVCVSPCYDIHLQQRLKRVKLSDNY